MGTINKKNEEDVKREERIEHILAEIKTDAEIEGFEFSEEFLEEGSKCLSGEGSFEDWIEKIKRNI